MISYLKHNEIDKEKWDNCIDESQTVLIYPNSWFLDIVCPNWNAVVYIEDNKYKMVLPVPWKKKKGLKYVYQPFFTQQLGVFHHKDFENLELEQQLYEKVFENYTWVECCISHPINLESKKLLVEKRITYVLDLTGVYERRVKNYTTNRKRNIKRAKESGVVVKPSEDIRSFVDFFFKNKGADIRDMSRSDFDLIRHLYEQLSSKGHIKLLNATLNGQTIASAAFLVYNGRVTFLLGTSNEAGRSLGAMTLVLDSVVSNSEGDYKVLDFEGSSIPSIAKFYSSFGAEIEQFWYLKYNNLPIPYRWFKK